MNFNLEHVIVADPAVDQNRAWISTQMNRLSLEAQPAYRISGFDHRIIVPYGAGKFEVRFTHDSNLQLANATLSDGATTFFLTDYLQLRSDDLSFDPDLLLKSKDLEEGLKKSYSLFDEEIYEAIRCRKLPNVPAPGDLIAVTETKLAPFMKSLGFLGSESSHQDSGRAYEFNRNGLKLRLSTAGRLDDGYVGMVTHKGIFSYSQLLKMLSVDSRKLDESVSRWVADGYYIGNYYKIANIVRLTFRDILEKVIPKL